MKKKFALIGAAGYVAPRHMKAIRMTGNDLVAAVDVNDSVGIIDGLFPDASFFTEIERFERHLELLRRKGEGVDFVSICTPNYLHDAHCRLGLRVGANVICEKPLVISPWNLDQLSEIEKENKGKIYAVLQLRLHPELMDLKKEIESGKFYNVELKYSTPRGKWYFASWKGQKIKSGGILTNIGVHLFDLLLWLFDFKIKDFKIDYINMDKAKGELFFENAHVKWELSLKQEDTDKGKPYRRLIINDERIRFDRVFEDLHEEIYKYAVEDKGFGIEDCRPAIELIHKIRKEYGDIEKDYFYDK